MLGAEPDALADRRPGALRRAHVGGLVVEHEYALDRRVLAHGHDDVAQPLHLAPDQRGVVERVAHGGRLRQQPAQALGGGRRERRQCKPEPLALVRGERGVAARAGEDGEPAARARSVARARAARARHRQALRQLEQVVNVGRPCCAGLLDKRPEDSLVAGYRARVGRRGGGSGRRRSDLQHGHAHAALGTHGERLAERRPVAVPLEVERDRADALLLSERGDPVGRIEHHGVAARDHRVEPEPTPGRERVHRHVAAL